jgi:hypothetical protein
MSGRITAEQIAGLGVSPLIGVHRGQNRAPGASGLLDLDRHRRSFSHGVFGVFASEVALLRGLL